MAFGYEIEKGNVVVIWADEKATGGNLVQETWPDGTKFKDKAEAEAWAKAFIKAAEDDKAPRPGNGPDAKTIKVAELDEHGEAGREALVKVSEEAVAAAEAEALAREAEIAALKEEEFADADPDREVLPLPADAIGGDIVDAEVVTE